MALQGARSAKLHPWFARGMPDWEALRERRLPAPWVPPIKSARDTSYFDEIEEEDGDDDLFEEDESGWEDRF